MSRPTPPMPSLLEAPLAELKRQQMLEQAELKHRHANEVANLSRKHQQQAAAVEDAANACRQQVAHLQHPPSVPNGAPQPPLQWAQAEQARRFAIAHTAARIQAAAQAAHIAGAPAPAGLSAHNYAQWTAPPQVSAAPPLGPSVPRKRTHDGHLAGLAGLAVPPSSAPAPATERMSEARMRPDPRRDPSTGGLSVNLDSSDLASLFGQDPLHDFFEDAFLEQPSHTPQPPSAGTAVA